jgi:hypothetical protein
MRNEPSTNPRDQALLAALHDAAALASIAANEFHSSYAGAEREFYLGVLGTFVLDLGGQLEERPGGVVVAFDGREITIRFGAATGWR